MKEQILLFLVVFGVNLLPAFGPPTWTILVVYRLNTDMPTWLLVLIGAAAAASGRFILANSFRLFASRLSEKSRRNLQAAREAIQRRRRNTVLALGLFALSPMPSAQLFEAAGLTGVRLLGFTLAFFSGRLVAYTIYAYTAGELRKTSWGEALQSGFSNPWILTLQLVLIAGLVLLIRIDWAKLLSGKPGGP
jgi:uncharacterized membrane protein YdjX (TVP38/TMEM64 family)